MKLKQWNDDKKGNHISCIVTDVTDEEYEIIRYLGGFIENWADQKNPEKLIRSIYLPKSKKALLKEYDKATGKAVKENKTSKTTKAKEDGGN